MKSWTPVLGALLLLAACSGSEQKAATIPPAQPAPATDSLAVEAPAAPRRDTSFTPGFFASFPDTLYGCSSYFTYDSLKVETGNYIFLTNYQELALLRVAGKDLYLHKDPAASSRPAEDRAIDVYRGGGYTVVLETQRVKSVDEVSYYTGELRITGHRVDVRYRVHGEGGC
jgi:hypothetical protein